MHEEITTEAKRRLVMIDGVVSVGESHDNQGNTIAVITVTRDSGLSEADFPPTLEGFPVVVEYGSPVRLNVEMNYREKRRPVEPGGSVGMHNRGGTGTLSFVFDDNGSPVITSNWHVLLGDVGDRIIQPGRADTGINEVIGNLDGWLSARETNFDIAWGTPTVPVAWGEVADIGEVTGSRSPRVGDSVVKHGRTTGTTFGGVSQTGAVIDVDGSYTMENQVIYDAETQGGDSGSPVMDPDTGEALGVHWGGNDEIAVMMDITEVENALGMNVAVSRGDQRVVDATAPASVEAGEEFAVSMEIECPGSTQCAEELVTISGGGNEFYRDTIGLSAGRSHIITATAFFEEAGERTIQFRSGSGAIRRTVTVTEPPGGGNGGGGNGGGNGNGDGSVTAGISPLVVVAGAGIIALFFLGRPEKK